MSVPFDPADVDGTASENAAAGGALPSASTPLDRTPLPESLGSQPTLLPSYHAKPDEDDAPITYNREARDLLDELGFREKTIPAVKTGKPEIPGYDLFEELGHGGMGIVYRALDRELNRVVALKMIRSVQVPAGDFIRFQAEAAAVAAIRHRHVVQVFDSGQHDGDPYFVMEFLSGGSLATRLKDGRRFAPHEAAVLIAKLASGAHAAHAATLVHRDIKAGNVLFDENGEPKLTDFGLAKRRNSTLTQTEAMLGTPAYMAPEQAGGRAKFVGPEADVYALGVLLYECLAGQRPFPECDTWTLIQQVLNNPPPPLAKFIKGIPRDLELICFKCLEKDPRHRYHTAEALAEDLGRFVRGEPVTVRPTPRRVKLVRWARRDPKGAALAALLVLGFIGLSIGLTRHEYQIEAEKAIAAESRKRHLEEIRGRKAAEDLAHANRLLAETAQLRHAEADRSRIAAIKLAESQSLIAVLDRVRRRATSRAPGWTWQNREDIAASLSLTGGNSLALRNLRSVSAEAALSADIRPAGIVARNLAPGATAFSPTTDLMALGEIQPHSLLTPCRIRLLQPSTGHTVRELTYQSGIQAIAGTLSRDATQTMAFTACGSRLFVGTRSGCVHRFDLTSPCHRPEKSWDVRSGPISQFGFSPDGRVLYMRFGENRLFKAFDTLTGEERGRYEAATPINGLAVRPRSGEVLVADSYRILRLDPVTLAPLSNPPAKFREPVSQVRFTTDGKLLYASQQNSVVAIDPETLQICGNFLDPGLRHGTHEENVTKLSVSPTGEYIATTTGGDDRTVKIWQAGTERLIGSVTVPGIGAIHLGWSGDGRFLFTTGADETLRFELRIPAFQTIFGYQPDSIERAVFTADGLGFVTLGGPGVYGSRIERVITRGAFDPMQKVSRVYVPGYGQTAFGLSPQAGSDRVLISVKSPGIRFWDSSADPVPSRTATTPVRLATFDRDGQSVWALEGNHTVRVWDASEDDLAPRKSWHARTLTRGRQAFSLDTLAVGQTRVVTGGSDGSVHILDADRVEELASFAGNGDAVECVAIRPDDRLAVAGTQRGLVKFFNLADGCEGPSLPSHIGAVTAVAFSYDGDYLVTGSKDRTLRLWRRVGERYEFVLTISDLPAPVRDLQFSSTDYRLLLLLAQERAIRVWDFEPLRTHLRTAKLGW